MDATGEWRVGNIVGYARSPLYEGWEQARFRVLAVYSHNRCDLLGIASGPTGPWPLGIIINKQYMVGWLVRHPEEDTDDPNGIP